MEFIYILYIIKNIIMEKQINNIEGIYIISLSIIGFINLMVKYN